MHILLFLQSSDMEKGGWGKTSNETHFQKMGCERVGCETTNVQVDKLTDSNRK